MLVATGAPGKLRVGARLNFARGRLWSRFGSAEAAPHLMLSLSAHSFTISHLF
eukprot:COSAG02_NODE_71903_length_189_cov_21.544444_1_plen_52_part_10